MMPAGKMDKSLMESAQAIVIKEKEAEPAAGAGMGSSPERFINR